MPKTRDQKKTIVKDFIDKLKKAKSVVFLHFDGLKVSEIEKLRKECRSLGIDYLVVKKSLMDIAFKEANITVNAYDFKRGVGTVFGYDDEVMPSKLVFNFLKEHQALIVSGGILDNMFIGVERVKELSAIPTRKVLLSSMVSSIKAPISGFVNVLAGNLRGLVQVLKAMSEKKV